MKKNIIILYILLLNSFQLLAQDTIVELKQLKHDAHIKARDTIVSITTDKKTIDFKIKKDKDKRAFEFVNPSADSNAFYELLLIDKTEINDKYNTALPQTSAALQLITVAANYANGIKLTRQELGGITSGTEPKEIGGVDVHNPPSESSQPWLWVAIAGIGGLILGFVLSLLMKRKIVKESNSDDTSMDIPEVKDEEIDNASEVKLKAQLKKSRDENRKLKAELKNINDRLASEIADLKNHDQFLHKYFSNAFNSYIKPFNEAVDKGDKTKAFQLMFEIAVQFTSLTKHELRVKQNFDTQNIGYIMKESVQGSNNIESITSETPIDNIPQNIKNIMAMMQSVGVQSLGQSIINGYKINKGQ